MIKPFSSVRLARIFFVEAVGANFVSSSITPHEQNKTWLFRIFRGLCYRVMWELLEKNILRIKQGKNHNNTKGLPKNVLVPNKTLPSGKLT